MQLGELALGEEEECGTATATLARELPSREGGELGSRGRRGRGTAAAALARELPSRERATLSGST